MQDYLADQIGSTQGVGLTYEVDFDSFKELWKKLFKKDKETPKKVPLKQPLGAKGAPISVMGNDSLVRFYTSTNKRP